MPLATLAQPAGISTPKTNAQLPFPFFINGNEVSTTGAVATSMRIRDPGFSGSPTLTFTIEDHNRSFSWLAEHQRVIWYDAVGGRYLFQGFISHITQRPRASWIEYDLTAQHISDVLDTGQPVVAIDLGAHAATDSAMIQLLLGLYCQEPSVGASTTVATLNATMPSSVLVTRSTLRNAIEQVLAATGVSGAAYYVDNVGKMHTMSTGDVNTPFNISDNPNYSSTVPADLTVEDQGELDVDALYVYGGTAAATGPVYSWQCGFSAVPALPLRWATLDAPQAQDRTGAVDAATVEFNRRMNATVVTAVISPDAAHGNFDGWAKGQLLAITNSALGWSAKQFTITAMDMQVINGKGQRRYSLTAGADPVLFSARTKGHHNKFTRVPVNAVRVGGPLGNQGLT